MARPDRPAGETGLGPLHALVVARGQQVLAMDARGALEFPHRTVCASHVGWGPDQTLATAWAAAGDHGRESELATAVAVGREVVALLHARPESTRRWWELRMPYPRGSSRGGACPPGRPAGNSATRG